VQRLIELALKAPTARHAQPWEFIVVKDRAVKARLARSYRRAWGLYGFLGRRPIAGNALLQRQLDTVQWQVEPFEEISVRVITCPRGGGPG
jgi:nitroreductase